MLHVSFQEERDVGSEMLPIGIERDGIGKAHAKRLAETLLQGISLASIL